MSSQTRNKVDQMHLTGEGYLKYLRVSTQQQEDEGYGLDVQDKGCNEYARRYGLPVIDPALIDDITGDTAEREGLALVKALLKAGKAKGIIIYRPDRLARKSWIGMQALEEIHSWGKEVHFENLGMISNTPEGRFNASIHFSVGELDKAQTLKKLKEGKREKIATHKRPLNQGAPPYGLRFVGSKKTSAIEIVPDEAEVIRLIYQLHAELKSIAAVTDHLTEHQFPTYEDLHPRPAKEGKRQLKQRGYGEWHTATVYKILKHPVYKGKYPYYRSYRVIDERGKRVERIRPLDDPAIVWVDVPAIVSEEVWDEAQRIIKENDSRGGSNRHVDYLLSRRLKCGECGCKASGKIFRGSDRGSDRTTNVRTRSLYYYVCNTTNYKEGRRIKSCHMPMFRRDQVEATVWEYVERHLLDPEGLEIGLRNMQANREEEHQHLLTQREDLQQKLDEIKIQRDRLISLAMNGIFTMTEIAGQKHQLDNLQRSYEDGLHEIEQQLETFVVTEQEIQQLKEFAAAIRERVDINDFNHRREILRIMGLEAEMQMDEDGTRYLEIRSHLSPANAERLRLISPNLHPSLCRTAYQQLQPCHDYA